MASHFESIPPDVMWMLLDHAPEYACALRLVSRSLKTRVDEYASTSRISFVEEIKFCTTNRDKNQKLVVYLYVSIRMKTLFDLRRLLFHQYNIDMLSRMEKYDTKFVRYTFIYGYEKGAANVPSHLIDCLGRSVTKVGLYHEKTALCLDVLKMLRRIAFKSLTIEVHTISEQIAQRLLYPLIGVELESISLTVSMVKIIDPVKLLLDLSSTVRALSISLKSQISRKKGLFGLSDWGPTILEMFSRKMDKLWIQILDSPGILSKSSADRIRERLPQLGKKIWFSVPCTAFDIRGHSYMADEHWIINNTNLRIVNLSRANEE